MDLQAKLTSLLKEKEEQEQMEQKAHQRIIELNRLIKSAERLIKDANEVFGTKTKFNLPFPIEMIPKDGEEHTVVIQHYSNGNSAMMLDGEIVAQNEPFNPAGVTSLDNLSMVLSDDMKTVYNEDKSFSKNLETEGPLTDAEMKRHFRTTAVIDDLANKQ